MRVVGEQRDRVEGLATELGLELDRGRVPVGRFHRDQGWLLSMIGTLALLLVSLAVSDALAASPRWVIPAAVLVGWYCVLGILLWAAPQLEVLDVGEKPRWRRSRGRIVSGLVTVGLGIVSSVGAASVTGDP